MLSHYPLLDLHRRKAGVDGAKAALYARQLYKGLEGQPALTVLLDSLLDALNFTIPSRQDQQEQAQVCTTEIQLKRALLN